MKKKIFKICCEYYVKAKDLETAQDFVIGEFAGGDFFEKHIMIEEGDCEKEDIFETI